MDAGVDADGDGVLSEAEVQSTAYVRNGAPGMGGPSAEVYGSATRLGGSAAGITVTLEGTSLAATTDANGAFSIPAVHTAERLVDVGVSARSNMLPQVTLRVARRVLGDGYVVQALSEGGDMMVVKQSTSARSFLVDIPSGRRWSLGLELDEASVDFAGRTLLERRRQVVRQLELGLEDAQLVPRGAGHRRRPAHPRRVHLSRWVPVGRDWP